MEGSSCLSYYNTRGFKGNFFANLSRNMKRGNSSVDNQPKKKQKQSKVDTFTSPPAPKEEKREEKEEIEQKRDKGHKEMAMEGILDFFSTDKIKVEVSSGFGLDSWTARQHKSCLTN